ncbi:MAG TPA: GH25 family lysozyme [Acidobacteriota bacterium]|jgi:GH25 family lysozyme M1 (1,4-beta-N-acetylmuramidase)|nr:GH25 family lysozyme [Acidobacteriota bacterium]
MTWTLNGRIESSTGENVSLAECRVDVFFDRYRTTDLPEYAVPAKPERALGRGAMRRDRPVVEGGTIALAAVSVSDQVSTYTDASGDFAVDLPDKTELANKTLEYVVSAPSGVTVAQGSFNADRVKDLLRIAVRRVERIPLVPLKTPDEPKTRRITGKVIERNGRALPPNLQVLLFSRKRGEKASKVVGEDAPILVARADASGYFAGDVPNEEFERVAGLVAGFADEIPVALAKGRLPDPVFLMVQFSDVTLPVPTKDDCHCEDAKAAPRTPTHDDIDNAPETYSTDLGTGQCIRFNKPNRAIEEFDFYSVVRTTEPDIRGVVGGTTSRWSTGPREVASIAAEPAAEAARAEAAAKAAEAAAATAASQAEKAEANAVAAENSAKVLADQAAATSSPTDKARADEYERLAKFYRQTARIKADEATSAATAAASARAEAESAKMRAETAAGLQADAESARAAAAARDAAQAARRAGMNKPAGRARLDKNNPVDWDFTPTFYEAATIAHGHLLHFKQVWYADGYSLGDLLYSLPLAPGQKKLISVVDWERRERAERVETTIGSEALNALIARDRDLGEVVTGTLTESSRGGSRNTTAGIGVGTGAAGNGSYQGFNFGALLGISGGYGESNSAAWMDSARNLSSTSLQTLRDRTLQSASAVRSLRASVVQTVSQGETVRATTEVVANHNHCHALTIQYFEVLRHLKLTHELTDVQECLFVPFPMEDFDLTKILRWRQALQTYLQRRELADAFDATRRVQTAWSEVDFPVGQYADEMITSLAGELTLTVLIPLPPFPERPKQRPEDSAADFAKATADAVNPTTGPLGVFLAIFTGGASLAAGAATSAAIDATKAAAQGARGLADEMYSLTPQERYEKFHHDVVPGVVQGFVDQLELWALVGSTERRIGSADFTLVSEYAPATPLVVTVRASAISGVRRSELTQLTIKSASGLPSGCRAIINTATIRYRTKTFEHPLLDDLRVNDDIDMPKALPVFTNLFDFSIQQLGIGQGATLYTPIDAWEQRSPRTEDRRLAFELVEHLNDNIEFYHHAIWWTMDPNRRYMLLDGYLAPGSKDRSVASVVENRLIGIVGNSLVMPVARGNHLDPRFSVDTADVAQRLLDSYKLYSPVPPTRISLPTRGVFAEAVMGSCNACEEIDDSKYWRWEESPIDEPPAIEPSSTSTRRVEPTGLQPTALPTPIVSIQNAPSIPDPTGVRAALDAITKQSFADITGLAGTQANAAAAFSKAMDTALAFGKEASTLAQQAAMTKNIGQTMRAIDKAEGENKIDKGDAKQLRTSALKTMTGDAPSDPKAASVADRLKVIDDQAASGNITPEEAAQRRAEIMKGLAPEEMTRVQESGVATEVMSKIPGESVESVETGTTKVTARPGSIPGLVGSTLLGAAPGAGSPAVVQRAFGIDVSRLNGRVDWDKFVSKSGHSFAFVKATEGTSIVDSRFQENWTTLENAPLIRGAYHFYRFNQDPEEQANLFMATVGNLDHPGDLPPVVDIEWQKDDKGNYVKPNADTLIADIRFWVQRVETRYGRKPIIYTAREFWEEYTDSSNDFNEYPLWVSTIWQKPPKQVSEPELFGGWAAWTFWQVGYDKTIPGVPTPKGFDGVDVNLFNGTLESLWPLAQMPRPRG